METLDKIYLELSNITTAKTMRELSLEKKLGEKEEHVEKMQRTIRADTSRIYDALQTLRSISFEDEEAVRLKVERAIHTLAD